ncbi:MAG: GNAT family N-acetyltransferase [Acidobacteria bacterium]|nr:GNAT family N-acetyltransferase [Acidobacteriota bacterium]
MEFTRIELLNETQIQELVALYQAEWWTRGRQIEDVRIMLAHCDVIVAFAEKDSGHLAGFSRVITDSVYKALILDVIVAETHRGSGLGKQLMDGILNHPKLKGVRHFELYCLPELIPFYRQWGFTEELGALRFMRKQ